MQFAQWKHQSQMRRIDDLQCNGLMLVQDTDDYCFTSDAVLLANYFKVPKGANVVELCSGSGVISILGSAKTNAGHFYCIERSNSLCEMCKESLTLNNLQNITIYNADVTQAPELLKGISVGAVVVNPPYFKVGGDTAVSVNPKIASATHEVFTNMQTIAQVSSKLLKDGGKLFMCYPTDRLAELFACLANNNLQPKHTMLVKGSPTKPISLALITAVKSGKVGLKIDVTSVKI